MLDARGAAIRHIFEIFCVIQLVKKIHSLWRFEGKNFAAGGWNNKIRCKTYKKAGKRVYIPIVIYAKTELPNLKLLNI